MNPEIVEVRKIWDAAPHNAFTDLQRFKGRWYCAFREGREHAAAGDYGKLRSKFGWHPRVSLEQGLRQTLRFYEEHRQHYWGQE